MPLSDSRPGFQASRGFVSYSWAFLLTTTIIIIIIVIITQWFNVA